MEQTIDPQQVDAVADIIRQVERYFFKSSELPKYEGSLDPYQARAKYRGTLRDLRRVYATSNAIDSVLANGPAEEATASELADMIEIQRKQFHTREKIKSLIREIGASRDRMTATLAETAWPSFLKGLTISPSSAFRMLGLRREMIGHRRDIQKGVGDLIDAVSQEDRADAARWGSIRQAASIDRDSARRSWRGRRG